MSLGLSSSASAVVEECIRLRKNILPISEKYEGALDKSNHNNTKLPFVFLLGNHSSGKSSFVNYVLGRKIQATGVAPTDDSFTIIGSGHEDIDKNGPALVGDPDLGFHGLQMFGPSLVNHTLLKIRADISIKDFMIVDSPGMIDSPATYLPKNNDFTSTPSKNTNEMEKIDRGYDFEAVCRWYAERADVILLFFDPDKPGTTGETLQILTNSLVGLDHKLFIILNKADQFHRIHDFARAYGSLCWNLSKVIPRKDLPRIHTMCLPASAIDDSHSNAAYNRRQNKTSNMHAGSDSDNDLVSMLTSESDATATQLVQQQHQKPPLYGGRNTQKETGSRPFLEQGRFDLEEARDEVILEVFNAPRRRIDNEISRLTDSISLLDMHCSLVDHITTAYRSKVFWGGLSVVGTGLLSVGVVVAAGYLFDWLDSRSISPVPVSIASEVTVDKPKITNPSLRGAAVKPQVVPSTASASSVSTTIAALPTAQSTVIDLFRCQTKRSVYFVTSLIGVCTTALTEAYRRYSIAREAKRLTARSSYEEAFRHIYSQEISNKDQYTLSLGEKAISHLVSNFSATKLEQCPPVKKEDKACLRRILTEDVANLRRRASPSYPLLSPVQTPARTPSFIWSSNSPVRETVQAASASATIFKEGVAAAPSSSLSSTAPVVAVPNGIVHQPLFPEVDYDDEYEEEIYTPTSADLMTLAQTKNSHGTAVSGGKGILELSQELDAAAAAKSAAVANERQQGLLAPKDSFARFDEIQQAHSNVLHTAPTAANKKRDDNKKKALVKKAPAAASAGHDGDIVHLEAESLQDAIGEDIPLLNVNTSLRPAHEELMVSPKELLTVETADCVSK